MTDEKKPKVIDPELLQGTQEIPPIAPTQKRRGPGVYKYRSWEELQADKERLRGKDPDPLPESREPGAKS